MMSSWSSGLYINLFEVFLGAFALLRRARNNLVFNIGLF
jgi:hypothetical protein